MILAFLVAVAAAQPPAIADGPPYGPKTQIVRPVAASPQLERVVMPTAMRPKIAKAPVSTRIADQRKRAPAKR